MTQQDEAGDDSCRQAVIEITPEMVEVGIEVLLRERPWSDAGSSFSHAVSALLRETLALSNFSVSDRTQSSTEV
ncbi:MAG: hypothetical protein GC166_01710 [Alphaproteobacteria bacterium]|nr:hypothetical protein [Alphaproteobacteria bacterium]